MRRSTKPTTEKMLYGRMRLIVRSGYEDLTGRKPTIAQTNAIMDRLKRLLSRYGKETYGS